MDVSTIGEKGSQEFTRILQKKKTTKKVAHLNEIFLKNITKVLPQYVFWKDINSVYLGCNNNYAALLGLNSPEEIIGKNDYDLNWKAIGHTAETFQKGDQDTIAGRHITNQEEVLALPSGKVLFTLVSKLPIIDNGKVIGIVGYFTDITELKNKEIELIEAKKQVEAANEAKSAFMTNISHDIRTPLTGMIGMTQILLKELKSKKGREAGSNLLKSSHLLLELLNEIIEVTKLGAHELPIYEVKFSLKEIVDKIALLVRPSTHEKGLELIIHYDKNIPIYLVGDPTRIHRILLNLVSNAIKFTSKGKIEINAILAEKIGKKVVLKLIVKDMGIGISSKNQEIIFSRFTRLEAAYKGNYKGAGLGLSIVKQFISEIEAEIYVESVEGKGSTFTCIIPLKEALLNESENKTSLILNKMLSPLELQNLEEENKNKIRLPIEDLKASPVIVKILLVEDTPIAQMAAKMLLEEMHCEVITADTGEIALELFKKDKYDLVFMDIGLPGKDGFETTKEMRLWEKEKSEHTPIIALTAHIEEDKKKESLKIGMEQVITKPLSPQKAQTLLELFIPNYAFKKEGENVLNKGEFPIIDLTLGAKIVGGNESEAKTFLDKLIPALSECKAAIKEAFKSHDFNRLQLLIHNLKGDASYCGVPRLQYAIKAIEGSLKIGSFDEIEDAYTNLLIEINNLLTEYKKVQ